jgi:hypothetical protein
MSHLCTVFIKYYYHLYFIVNTHSVLYLLLLWWQVLYPVWWICGVLNKWIWIWTSHVLKLLKLCLLKRMWNFTGPAAGICRWRRTTCLVLQHRVTRPCRPLLSWPWWFWRLVCNIDGQHICALFCIKEVPDLRRLKLHRYVSRLHFLTLSSLGTLNCMVVNMGFTVLLNYDVSCYDTF